nr:MAG: 2,4-dienoyl-CoA reductase [Bacillota bacterium]
MLPEGIFAGQVALITGGGTGLGRAMALELARLGARVVVASRKQENLERVVWEIEAAGGEALAVPMDVRNPEDVDRTVRAALERFGRIDHLVNNAAGNFVVPAEELSINGWNAVVGIVLNGTFYMTRAVGRHWIHTGQRGNILNIVATYAWTGGPGVVHSAAAKAGVVALTRTLAVEWARYGIRVNALAPGVVDGTGAAAQLWPEEATRQRLLGEVPTGRFGTPEEVARVAAFLLSPYAEYITGEVLVQDGGLSLGKPLLQPPSSSRPSPPAAGEPGSPNGTRPPAGGPRGV